MERGGNRRRDEGEGEVERKKEREREWRGRMCKGGERERWRIEMRRRGRKEVGSGGSVQLFST